MRTRLTLTLVLVAVVVAAMPPALAATTPAAATPSTSGIDAGSAPPATVGSSHDACASVAAGAQRDDPGSDRLGWENGCWYDDPIAVDASDGLNDTEMDAVVSRAMARVERIRQLEFEQTVPVEIITRSEYRAQTGSAFANLSGKDRLHQNVKFEATFIVGEDTDAIAEMKENRGTSVQGFYDPGEDRIVVITENESSPEMDELTLAHELAHAVQDQHFDIGRYNRSTEDTNNAISGIVEGDAHYIEYLYEQRCGAEWSCSIPESEGPGGVPPGFNWGLYFITFQPYSDGPVFVQQTRNAGGWEAVNRIYENPPASSEQVIHPDKYPGDEPAEVTVEDRSNDEWHVLDLEGGIDYATFGEGGLFTMFLYPTYETRGRVQLISTSQFINRDSDGEVRDLDPLDYSHRWTDGWDGDKLYPYVTNDSAQTNETGYVWKLVWDTETDAREFVTGYKRLLDVRGADPVEGRENTYRIPDEEPYGDAFYVNRTGTTVVIVNAPAVEELSEVRAGAAPEVEVTPTPTSTATATETATSTGTTTRTTTETSPATETTTPGFGPAVAALALLGAALLAIRRR